MRLLHRLLFALLAANLLLSLWHVLRSGVDELEVSTPAGSPNSLVHIGEVYSPVLIRYPVDFIETGSDQLGLLEGGGDIPLSSCFMRGPFASDDAARASMSGSGMVFSVAARRKSLSDSPLYRAMIAPSDSFEDAQRRLSEVTAAIERLGGGVDTYLVTSGPIKNAVSLGVFSDHSNAINVQRLLSGEGIDVVVEPELRVEVGYWVVTNNADAFEIIDESTGLQVFQAVPVELSENLCEMIAQAE